MSQLVVERADLLPDRRGGGMLAFLTKWTKRSREGDPKENQRPAAEGAADAHKKRKLATPPTKARRPRSVPPPHPVGSSRVNIKQVSLDEGYVVLTNDGRTGVSIEGWTLRSGSTTTLAIPAGTVLDAHCAILVLAPSAKPPAVLKHSGMRQLRAKAPWTEGLMLYNRDGVLIDGEGGDSASRDSPFHGVLCRAEEYYRTLVSQLVAQRLFAKSPNFVGPSHVNAKNVRLTHDAREVRTRGQPFAVICLGCRRRLPLAALHGAAGCKLALTQLTARAMRPCALHCLTRLPAGAAPFAGGGSRPHTAGRCRARPGRASDSVCHVRCS